jgi:hypothetical protein
MVQGGHAHRGCDSQMAKDHFIPKAYLRGFTREYLTGQKGGKLVVYNPSSGNSGMLSINKHVGCESEFYNNHPLDKKWSQTIERTWEMFGMD